MYGLQQYKEIYNAIDEEYTDRPVFKWTRKPTPKSHEISMTMDSSIDKDILYYPQYQVYQLL